MQGDVAWRYASTVLVRSDAGVIEWISPAVSDLLGYAADELGGSQLLDLTHPDDRAVVLASRSALAADGRAAHRGRLRHRDGSWRWIATQVTASRDPDGVRRTRALSTWRDVTKEVQLVAAMEASQQAYRLIAENASDVVLRGTDTGEIDWVSPSVTAMVGWDPDELVGRAFASLVHPDDAAKVAAVQAALVDGAEAEFEARVGTSTGSWVWVAVTVRQVELPGGARSRVGSWRNIQRKMETREALAASNRLFRLLAEHGSDVVLLVDGDGRISWVSPSTTAITGWDADALVGTTLSALLHPEDAFPALATAGDEERAVVLVRIGTATGGHVWMSGTVASVVDPPNGDAAFVVALHDVGDRVEAQQSMQADRARLQATLSSLLDPHVLLVAVRNPAGSIVDFVYGEANDAACRYMTMTRSELVGARLLEVLPGQAATGMLALYAAAVDSGEPLVLDDYAYPHEILGSERRYDIRGVRVGDALSFTWRDVTDRSATARALAASEARYRLLAENASDVVMHLRDGTIEWVSPSIRDTFGWDPGELIGQPSTSFTHPDDHHRLLEHRATLSSGGSAVFRLRGAAKGGQYHWIEVHGSPFTDANGQQDGVVVSWRVVDTQVANETELARRAHHDELSGLLNRRAAISTLTALLANPTTDRPPIAIVFCDVDNFKQINDELGHQAGDDLIRHVARRLAESVRDDDIVARLGGDEFLIILNHITDTPIALAVADNLRRHAAEPIHVNSHILTTTVSMGVAVARSHETVTDLLARADHAMYKAKRAGRDQVCSADG